MERLTTEEVQQIKDDWNDPYMGKPNSFWENRIDGLFDTIEAQQQEIEQLETRLSNIKTSVDYIKRDINEADKVHLYVNEIKSQCDKYGENSSRILLDRLKTLTADKDEQAGRIMQMDYVLRRTLPILEVTNDQQGMIDAINALLGGKEDV